MVWAVDEAHAWTYLFPRDCPRVLLWPVESTTSGDREHWLHAADGKVACIEWDWFEQLSSTTLYRYELPPESFRPLETEDTEWMYVSRVEVTPMNVAPIGSLLDALASSGVELRLMPSLAPLHGAWESTVHFSGIRLRNAKGWPG